MLKLTFLSRISPCICTTMAGVPEYNTLVQCSQKLRVAIQGDLINLSGHLLAAGLISPDTSSEMRNGSAPASERAAKLVALIINKVQLNPRSYSTFIDVLSQESHYYSDILRILNETYSSLRGTLQLLHNNKISFCRIFFQRCSNQFCIH